MTLGVLLSRRINEHFNSVFVSKVTRGNSIFGQIVYFALNSFVNLHLIRFEILGLCCINYPLAIFCAGSNSGHNQVVQGLPRVLQIRPKELSRAEKVFCPTKTLSECKLDIKSFPFTGLTTQSQEHLCDSKSVVLRDVHADMSGYYTCEVTTQVIYETVQMKHYLLVVRK